MTTQVDNPLLWTLSPIVIVPLLFMMWKLFNTFGTFFLKRKADKKTILTPFKKLRSLLINFKFQQAGLRLSVQLGLLRLEVEG